MKSSGALHALTFARVHHGGSRVRFIFKLAIAVASLNIHVAQAASGSAEREEWLALFNGRDLTGWTPKIARHALGDNYANTFRVEGGVLKASYDGYQRFDMQFAHLFYERPFAYYRLRLEYRLVGEPAAGAPPWAIRNSGVMLHAQDPATMRLNQGFPISVEAQFLAGFGDGKPRPTLNVCTPGTEIVIDGALAPEHCTESRSPTFDGDQWVRAEVVVLGSASITHFVNGQKVLEYQLLQYGGSALGEINPGTKPDGQLLERGYIALQAESTPVEFRNVQLLNLEGCMDQNATNYKKYYVKSLPSACRYE